MKNQGNIPPKNHNFPVTNTEDMDICDLPKTQSDNSMILGKQYSNKMRNFTKIEIIFKKERNFVAKKMLN